MSDKSQRLNKAIEINRDICEMIIETGAEDVFKCYQCGNCMALCPWNQIQGVNYVNYRFSQRVKLGTIIESEEKDEIELDINDVFRCVGCDSCLYKCPRGVNTSNILRAIRRILVDFQSLPDTLKATVRKVHNVGNPLGESRDKRSDWAVELNIPECTEEMDYLYFSCCLPAYETRIQKVAQESVKILQKSGISFGTIGNKESCCGEAIRRIGAETVFEEVSKSNIKEISNVKAANVIVNSPHCYTTFKNEYPELGAEFDAVHLSVLFSQLINDKKIVPMKPFNKKVVYHDPCTLGRQNGIYEEPRSVLKSIPGLQLLEVKNFNRKDSLCCGAGSGGLWMEWDDDERIVDVRLRQLIETGADVIAVACPYCLQMFEETLKSMETDVEVMDVTEILYGSI